MTATEPTVLNPEMVRRVSEAVAPDPLFGMELAGYHEEKGGLIYEQPWHTHAANYIAAGFPKNQVAKMCDVSEASVLRALRTPFFQEMVKRGLDAAGGKDVLDVLKAESMSSIATLIEIRDDPDAPKAVRAKIADSILDRILGKPVQRVETDATVRSGDPLQEVERLEQELSLLRPATGNN